jgi:hypothetical protein
MGKFYLLKGVVVLHYHFVRLDDLHLAEFGNVVRCGPIHRQQVDR